MKKLNSLNFDVIKRPRVLGALAAIVVLVAAFYLAWWSPEGSKLASINQTKQQETQQISSLQAQLVTLRNEARYVSRYQNFLTFFGSELPPTPEQGPLYTMLARLAQSDNVSWSLISATTPQAPTPPAKLGTIPLTMQVAGKHQDVLKFLADLYALPRLVTIQAVSPDPNPAPSPAYDVLTLHDQVPFTLAITGTAYFASSGTTAPAAG